MVSILDEERCHSTRLWAWSRAPRFLGMRAFVFRRAEVGWDEGGRQNARRLDGAIATCLAREATLFCFCHSLPSCAHFSALVSLCKHTGKALRCALPPQLSRPRASHRQTSRIGIAVGVRGGLSRMPCPRFHSTYRWGVITRRVSTCQSSPSLECGVRVACSAGVCTLGGCTMLHDRRRRSLRPGRVLGERHAGPSLWRVIHCLYACGVAPMQCALCPFRTLVGFDASPPRLSDLCPTH